MNRLRTLRCMHLPLMAGCILSLLLLSACGFHLRGAVLLPPELARMQIIGISAHSERGEEITAVLQAAGAQVVVTDATAQLHISGEQQSRRLLSVGISGRAAEYELDYTFAYELRIPVIITDQDGVESVHYRVELAQQNISLQRDYSFDSSNVLGAGGEEELLLREMRSLAVHQMLRQLRYGLMNKQVEGGN